MARWMCPSESAADANIGPTSQAAARRPRSWSSLLTTRAASLAIRVFSNSESRWFDCPAVVPAVRGVGNDRCACVLRGNGGIGRSTTVIPRAASDERIGSRVDEGSLSRSPVSDPWHVASILKQSREEQSKAE